MKARVTLSWRGNDEQASHIPAIALGHPRLPFPLLESWAQIPVGWSYHHDKASLYNKGQLSLGLLVHQRSLGALDPQWQRSQGLECGRSRGRRKWGVVNHAPLVTRPPQSDACLFSLTFNWPCPSSCAGWEVQIYHVCIYGEKNQKSDDSLSRYHGPALIHKVRLQVGIIMAN